ncbi:hypothetical protein NDU88_003297 [Pleurodeles waltl]|uniref:Uncharacterized protein n=1 Tax=Pleurodeles waltl TaxID=8319 RepID=A0AAV7PDE6_PLEWA|nr:hypothetical protein NDU88_003297 [Pleurodeles waltl]
MRSTPGALRRVPEYIFNWNGLTSERTREEPRKNQEEREPAWGEQGGSRESRRSRESLLQGKPCRRRRDRDSAGSRERPPTRRRDADAEREGVDVAVFDTVNVTVVTVDNVALSGDVNVDKSCKVVLGFVVTGSAGDLGG